MLELCHLTKSFGGIKAVDDCSFAVEQGKITALIGPNGAGKSTVFNCISGIEMPEKGNILYYKDDMSRWRMHERADAGIARTFQLTRVFKNLTVYENVALAVNGRDQYLLPSFFGFTGLSDEQRQQVSKVLERLKLAEKRNTRAAELSYGQQKLLSLARALVQPHKVLLLDEPVAGVHPTLRRDFVTLFRSLRDEGETLLLIEHDMDFVMEVADRVVVMNEGKVLMQGSPEEVRKDKRVLEVYLGKSE